MSDPDLSPAPEREGRAPSDRSLLTRVRVGDEGAAGELYDRYARRLRELARAQCSPQLARAAGLEDIVQSVFGSFFRGVRQGYYEVPAGEELWKLFLVIALNKIRAKGNYHRAAKRDLSRTVGGAGGACPEEPADSDEATEPFLRLAVEDVLGRLPPQHREVVRLRLEGHDVTEVASAIGRSKRSTERLLQEARGWLAEFLGREG